MSSEKEAIKFGKILLTEARTIAGDDNFNRDRLPDWLDGADIRIGRLHHTWLFLFSPSVDSGDEIGFLGEVSSIIELLTEIPDKYLSPEITPAHTPSFTPEDHVGIHLAGAGSEGGKSPIVDINMESPNMFNVKLGHHTPFFVSNLLVRFTPIESPIATGYIPFLVFIHDYDFNNIENILRIFRIQVSDYIFGVHNSEIGDFYERRKGKEIRLFTSKKNSAIVLGDYDGWENEEELHRLRDEFEARGYRASLIKELPEDESQSLPQKVKMWSLTSRFVVVIDREPSGHIREYSDLCGEDIPIALLREVDSRSTYMIGHEHLTNDFVELFEFDVTPNELTQDVIAWVEEFIDDISERYDEHYPWR